MKSRDAKKSQRREEKKEDQKRESLRRKKIQVRENVGKSRNTAFFPKICGSGGSKSRLAKSSRCGARWADERWKITRRCGAKHISKSKCTKHTRSGPLLEVEKVEKAHAVVARSKFRSQNVKNTRGSDHFWTFRCRFCMAGARDCAPCQKWAKREGFAAFPNMMEGVGHLKRICKDAFSVAGAVQETCSSELLGGPGADFLRRVAFWSIRSSGLLWWFCVTGAALRMTRYHFFVASAVVQTGGVEKSQNALVRGRQLCTQLSIFEGSLAELLRFWFCQLRKLRKSRRHVSCSMLSSSKIEDVSQTCFALTLSSSKIEEVSQNSRVFKLADR